MNNTIKYVVIASLILSVIAIGVAMTSGGKDGRDGVDGKDATLGGITNYDEVGTNNVATGKVNLLYSPSATDFSRTTGHRLGWTNNTGGDVIVSNQIIRQIGQASSTMTVTSATSTSETATTPLSDFGQYSGTFAGTGGLLWNHFVIATGTRATSTISGTMARIDGTSTSTTDTLLVRSGEAIQFVVAPRFMASGGQGCIGGTSYNQGSSNFQNCELATSTNWTASLQFQFDYTFRDPNQPEP